MRRYASIEWYRNMDNIEIYIFGILPSDNKAERKLNGNWNLCNRFSYHIKWWIEREDIEEELFKYDFINKKPDILVLINWLSFNDIIIKL